MTAFVLGLVAVGFGAARAGETVVRVYCQDYWQLYDRVPFKGTSIEIVGVRPGESYDLILDQADLGLVLGCGLKTEVIVEDLGELKLAAAESGQYHSYDQLVTMMRDWASSHPTICVLESIGQTYEGRWIVGLKISDNPGEDENEPELLFVGVHHAREWAAAQVPRHMMDTLLNNYLANADFREFIDNHELWVFPVVNVDGYVYDYPAQRSWRKNRQPFSSSIGCDPNRDYGGTCAGDKTGDWGSLVRGSQTSHRPSDVTWFGASGNWGYCIAALSGFFKQHTFVAVESYHSYSELVLWPFGHGPQTPDNAYYSYIGTQVASRISKLRGGTYTPEQGNQLYPTNCGSDDWMYGWAHWVGGFPCLSFTVELGTSFYQPVADLDMIQTEAFQGAFYHMQMADSIIARLEGEVPPPVLAEMDSSSTGDFTVHWTPVRPEHNHPDRWELEELSGFAVNADDIESGSARWQLEGFSVSTGQAHSATHSLFSGTGNNISNYAASKDPYPVQHGDSLTFWVWYDLENNYDVGVAEVSENRLEWVQLHDRYTGNSSGWQRRAYSLEPWAGRSVYIRFRCMTDDGTLRAGMYVDDIHPVPSFANRRIVADNISDTLYQISVADPGTYWYRVRGHNAAWDWNSQGPLEDIVVTGTGGLAGQRPGFSTRLLSVVPSPSELPVSIRLSPGQSGRAQVDVYDATGRLVRSLLNGNREPGEYRIDWDGTDESGRLVSDGIYFCELRAGEERSVVQRFVLAR